MFGCCCCCCCCCVVSCLVATVVWPSPRRSDLLCKWEIKKHVWLAAVAVVVVALAVAVVVAVVAAVAVVVAVVATVVWPSTNTADKNQPTANHRHW